MITSDATDFVYDAAHRRVLYVMRNLHPAVAFMLTCAVTFAHAHPPREGGPAWAGGGRVGVDFGGAQPVGDGSDAVGFGIRGGAWGGYEFLVGPLGITPRLSVGFLHFLDKDASVQGIPGKVSYNLLTILDGAKLTYHSTALHPYVSVAVGYARVSGSFKAPGVSAEGDDNELGLQLGGGIDFALSGPVAFGPFFHYSRAGDYKWLDFGLGVSVGF